MSDTSEITNGSLVHYDSSHIQTRRDFMGLCKYSRETFEGKRKQEPNQECMAKIVRLIETLTNHAKAEWKLEAMKAEEKGLAKPKEPKRYPLELSNGVIIRLIYETFGESTVRNSLNYLLEIGYIGREQEKANAIPLYWLEQEYVQSLLKTQAEIILAGFDFVPPSFQGLKSYPGPVKSNPKRPKSNPRGSEITGLGSESTDNNISNNIDNNITYKKDKDDSGANAPTPAHLKEVVNEKIEEVQWITDKHKAVQPNDTVSHSHSHSAIGNERVETPGRCTLPSKDKIGVSIHGADTDSSSNLLHSGGNSPTHHSASTAAARGVRADRGEETQGLDPQHTPGPGALPSAADPFFGRHGNTSDQASRSLLPSEPAQADFPPAGSTSTPTAQASGRRSPAPRRPKGKPAVLELTLAGMDVKSWYEQVRGKLRMTERNVNDCNALGECDGIELESLRVYFEHVEALKWVKQYGVVIDLATAAGTTGNDKLQFLSFESNWPLVKKKLKGTSPPGEVTYADNDMSITAQLWRQEHRERSAK